MKLLGMLLSLVLANPSQPTISLIDKNLKKPIGQTHDFNVENYVQRLFPVYADDVSTVAATVDDVVRLIGRDRDFSWDTVRANHSYFILNTEVVDYDKVITIRLGTSVEAIRMSFDFELVKMECDIRKAQRKLLDFADYLSK